MHEHDLDLIASLAEGGLDPEAARRAEETIAPCAECAAGLRAQRTALAAVAASPAPGLSMAESAALRRSVEAAVGRVETARQVPQKRRWLGLVAAAAAVVVLLAVAPLVNLLSTGSGDSVAIETTVDTEQRETVADAPAAAATPEVAATTAPAAGEAPARVAAPSEDAPSGTASVGDGAGPLPESFLNFTAVQELDEFLEEVPKGIDEDLTSTRALTPDEISYFRDQFAAALEQGISECPAQAALDVVADPVGLVTVGEAEIGGLELLVVLITSADGSETVVALDGTTCEVAGLIER